MAAAFISASEKPYCQATSPCPICLMMFLWLALSFQQRLIDLVTGAAESGENYDSDFPEDGAREKPSSPKKDLFEKQK
uniref:Uncharacterized protein n=1 Tax=Ciona intestinalis TaxID=7719 RepID=H2XNX6_CIOIN